MDFDTFGEYNRDEKMPVYSYIGTGERFCKGRWIRVEIPLPRLPGR